MRHYRVVNYRGRLLSKFQRNRTRSLVLTAGVLRWKNSNIGL